MTCRVVLVCVLLLTSAAPVAAPERARDGTSSVPMMASDGDWADDSVTGSIQARQGRLLDRTTRTRVDRP